MVNEFPQAQVSGEGGRQEQAGIGHQAMIVKEDADTVGFVLWQHLLGAPCFRAGFCSKTIIPDSEEHPLASSRTVPKDVLRWIRVYIDFPKSRNNQVVSDDDSGGGLSGTNSELVYRAPHTGEYFIAVTEAVGNSSGGYYLSVEPAREGTETVSVPPRPQIVDSRFGTMLVFEDPLGYFSIQAPEAWLEGELGESQGEVFYAFDPETNSDIRIIAEDVLALGAGELSLTEYADLFESSVLIPAGAEDIIRETVRTSQGSPAIIFQMSIFTHRVIRMVYLLDNNIAVSITYSFTANRFDMGKQLADYSFDSFHVN